MKEKKGRETKAKRRGKGREEEKKCRVFITTTSASPKSSPPLAFITPSPLPQHTPTLTTASCIPKEAVTAHPYSFPSPEEETHQHQGLTHSLPFHPLPALFPLSSLCFVFLLFIFCLHFVLFPVCLYFVFPFFVFFIILVFVFFSSFFV